MKTTINIECEEKRELLMHLEMIKEIVITQFDDIKEEIVNSNLKTTFEEDDSNCYGTHTLIIKE